MAILWKPIVFFKCWSLGFQLSGLERGQDNPTEWKLEKISEMYQSITHKSQKIERKRKISNTDLLMCSVLNDYSRELGVYYEEAIHPLTIEMRIELYSPKSITRPYTVIHGYSSDTTAFSLLKKKLLNRQAYLYSNHPKAELYRLHKSTLKTLNDYGEVTEKLAEKLV